MWKQTALFGLALSNRCHSLGVLGRFNNNGRLRSLVLRGVINGDHNLPGEGTTGWNHNLPGPASDFWKSSAEGSPTSEKKSTPDGEIQTGWLHNTDPAKSIKSQSKSESSSLLKMESPKAGTNLARQRLEEAKLEKERNHRIINPPALHFSADGSTGVFAVTEHAISVPLRYGGSSSPAGGQNPPRIDVSFSIVELVPTPEKRVFFETTLKSLSPQQRAKAYLAMYAPNGETPTMDKSVLYLQGGPGFGAPTPIVGLSTAKSSWLGQLLSQPEYNRVVLMDQRGTGRSTPITKQTLELKFPSLFLLDEPGTLSTKRLEEFETSDQKEAVQTAVADAIEYMTYFRADNIVKDAEYIREALLYRPILDDNGTESSSTQEPRPWGCSLGQSYGGFCQMSYLSLVPNPPRIMLFTGGIAPMLSNVDHVYSSLWDTVKERNLRFYEQYPGDIAHVKAIVNKLLDDPPILPSGGKLTARRFLCTGIALGGSPSAFAGLHNMITTAFVPGTTNQFSRAFLKALDSIQSFDDHPIYFWLHESIYADGTDCSPTNWSAHRVYEAKASDQAEFDYRITAADTDESKPVLLFGEHVFPWFVEDFAELNGVGLQAVAEGLATKNDWEPLYDATAMKATLMSGKTRAAAVVYHEDMYVDFDACMKVTARDGPLGKVKLFVTNEYQHSGLRDNGGAIVAKLHGMAKGAIGTPS
jgi:hypothetical protein